MARRNESNARDTRDIILDQPGILAVGDYRPGKVYTVPATEADRLVSVKGFRYADAADPTPPTESPAEAAPE